MEWYKIVKYKRKTHDYIDKLNEFEILLSLFEIEEELSKGLLTQSEYDKIEYDLRWCLDGFIYERDYLDLFDEDN